MNNSTIQTDFQEPEVDIKPMLRERSLEVAEILSALENIKSSSYWNVLQQKVFAPRLALLLKRLKLEPDTKKIFQLQGAIQETEQHMDLATLSLSLRKELDSIKNKLK